MQQACRSLQSLHVANHSFTHFNTMKQNKKQPMEKCVHVRADCVENSTDSGAAAARVGSQRPLAEMTGAAVQKKMHWLLGACSGRKERGSVHIRTGRVCSCVTSSSLTSCSRRCSIKYLFHAILLATRSTLIFFRYICICGYPTQPKANVTKKVILLTHSYTSSGKY